MIGAQMRAGVRRRPWVQGALAALAAALASCGQPASPTATSSVLPVSTSRATTSASPVPAADLKSVIHGLVDRTGPPPSGYLGSVTNFVVDAPWSELQPTAGGPLAPDNVIDQAIAAAQSLNAGAGQGKVEVKIRLLAGIDAPDWAKQLGGAPVSLVDPQSGDSGTVGRFWTAAFGQAYDALWSKLAAAYDNVPEIHEITVARCMTFTDEPFLRDVSDPADVQSLLAAGFTIEADDQCQEQEIEVGTMWHHTRIGVAFNPYQAILADGSTSTDEAFTDSMMQYCRSELGPQCVLENNSIRTPPLAGAYTTMYAEMEQLGPPITFQTSTDDKIGNLQETLSWAARLGADAVELPEQYVDGPAASLAPAASVLQGNPVS
ncbi:MAG: hypothetical protein ACLQGJ_05050 [Candidatus Dormibacteria bacterium]